MAASLSFYGAAENVTGSCFLLQVDGIKILIDCGLYQERDLRDRNWDEFPVPANEIDAVLITHAHIDHCGRLPKLVKEGFDGKVYCTHATKEIAGIVLLDCGHLQEEDAEYKRKRHKKQGRVPARPVEALYNVEDAEKTLPHFSSVDYKQPIVIADRFEVTFHDAGHILGSSIIKIKVPIDGQSRTLLFTGDVGRAGRPILQDPSIFDEADYILLESTYGDRTHDTFEDTKEKLTEAINNAFEAGGNILVPSFAIERSQEIMYFLNELIMEDKIPPIMAFLDSPMAVRVTEVFRKHPELFDNLTVTGTISATTIDAADILSGGTNILDIFSDAANDTYVTGGTVTSATDDTNSASISLLYKNDEGGSYTGQAFPFFRCRMSCHRLWDGGST